MAETAYNIFNEVQDLLHPCGPDNCKNNNRVAAAFDRLKAIPADAAERIERLERRGAHGKCKVHEEPMILIWRCEEPANMNGAPRTVCPECLEEQAERLKAALSFYADTKNWKAVIYVTPTYAECLRGCEALRNVPVVQDAGRRAREVLEGGV